ncbi:MAG: hypothetical protein IE926_08695 [Micrococcales bacterium]|nr:hypothetical protein [Micrococcales bacterium]
MTRRPGDTALDLYWIPLGAGRRVVRLGGRWWEAAHALAAQRPARDLYHAVLVVTVDDLVTSVEMAPVWQRDPVDADRAAAVVGPVALRALGRWRLFRYEVRCWPGYTVPDLAAAVGGRHGLSDDPARCRAVLHQAGHVPALTWGRDELGLGEMWNSNSVVAWLLARAGVDSDDVRPPTGGAAPGWDAGRGAAQIQLGNHIRQCQCS